MYAALKALQFLTLCLMLGGPLFWWGIWGAIFTNPQEPVSALFLRRIKWLMLLSGSLFILGSLADGVRAASQVVEIGVWSEVGFFFVASRYGQMALLKALLTPICLGSFIWAARGVAGTGKLLTGLSGFGIILAMSFASHAAARPGWTAVIVDILHLCGVVIWGGGLLYFLLLPWHTMRQTLDTHHRPLRRLVTRFSSLALVTVITLAITGSISTFLHVYGWAAFSITPYGRTLLGKIGLFMLALGIAGVHLMAILPGWQNKTTSATRAIQRFLWLLGVEAACVTGALILAGVLTTYPPAERAGYIAQHVWQRPLPPWQMQLTMTPTDEQGLVQFTIDLQDQHGQPVPPNTSVTLLMQMLDHDMGLARFEATARQPGQFTAPGRVSMAGNWQVGVAVQPPAAEALMTTVDFEATTGTLERDRERRLDLTAIPASVNNIAVCVLGFGSGLIGAFAIWASRRAWLPVWGLGGGTVLLLWGSGMILSVILVDAYPTTYVRNPEPFTALSVAQGKAIFLNHCALCHGPEGHGDGPGAAGLVPKPANLTEAHVDEHTDGEMFWWVSHGIPGTAMPAWEEQLSETERWQVIHFVRSLRRGVPGA